MKKHILLFAALILSGIAFTQNQVNLVIFSEDGDPFYAFINGVRQNDKPETNVKVTGVSPNISLRIEFENKALPQLKQNMALEPGYEHTAKIKRDMKKQLKLRYFGQTPLNDASSSGVATVQYHAVENAAPATAATSQLNSGNQTVTSTTTTTTHTRGSDNTAVNMNMSGVGISMNVTGMDPGTHVNTTTSTTVTTSSSSSGSAYSDNTSNTNQYSNTATTGNGCSAPMSQSGFGNMKKSVEAKPFSDTKMSTAKVATKNSCLSVAQIKEICKLFSMDDDKLTYAKYAYDYCVDKANYYQVSEVFAFSSTTDEFNKFLEQ
jgi:hypothetical protein